MSFAALKALLLSFIFVALFDHASGLTETSEMVSLLESVNDTSNAIASILPHMASSIRNQEANILNQIGIVQEADRNQTAMILSQLAATQTQMARDQEATQNQTTMILTQLAATQTQMARDQEANQNQTTMILSEMANALNQVVRMLQDMNTCFSSPCQNQGQCVRSLNSYTCKCQPGWTGDNCEIGCGENPFFCMVGSSACIPNDYLCDGWSDCDGGEDESGHICCADDEFICSNDRCVSSSKVCDGVNDCGTSDDEQLCVDECSSVQCQNGGQCIDGVNNYTCQCLAGWTGDLCEIDIDECSSAPCQNGGQCKDGDNNYTCQCLPGWTGNLCETNIDECSNASCLNDGQCIDGINQFDCKCATGYIGQFCEINVTNCYPSPCQNKARCVNEDLGYTCECLAGWTGQNCSINMNECTNVSCQNGGQCIDGVNSYTCQCLAGWTGNLCGLNRTCQPADFVCDDGQCIPADSLCDGFPNCDNGTDEEETTCATCPNKFLCTHGECVDLENVCDGTDNCHDNSDEDQICVDIRPPNIVRLDETSVTLQWIESKPKLAGNPQRNITQYAVTITPQDGGESQVVFVSAEDDVVYTFTQLQPGTTHVVKVDVVISTEGQSEQTYNIGVPLLTLTTDIDECSSTPCQNEGLCIDGVNNYTCQCVEGYKGNLCEINIDECSGVSCQNGGQCIDGVNQFTCQCVEGYTGYFCENSPTCQPGNFLCDDGSCIPGDWVCDKYPDCQNGSDEEETLCYFCPFKFLCTNGRCADLENVCDGTDNCQDNSDENQICVVISSPSAVRLSKTSVTLQWNEPAPELTGTLQRHITQYVITATPQSDGESPVGESKVIYVPVDANLYYMSCIIEGLQPDTTYNIEGTVVINTEGQGEQTYETVRIPMVTATTHINACASGPCQNGGQCVEEVADYSCQCVRGFTGPFCGNSPTCQAGEYLCDDAYGSCIPNDLVCDGFSDCNNGIDEEEVLCAFCPFQFLCTNGRCTDLRNVCDGTNNCRDNSDEEQICVDISQSIASFDATSITLQWNAFQLPEPTGTPQRNITHFAVSVTSQDGRESKVVYLPTENMTETIVDVDIRPRTTYDIQFYFIINTKGQGELKYNIGILPLTVCLAYLGMENGDIMDGNIMAYTYTSSSYSPRYARLNGGSYWRANTYHSSPWIQADIGYQTYVSGVVTQGDGRGYSYWVTSYRVSTFSMTTSNPETYVRDDEGSIKVFPGNTNYHAAVTSYFPLPVFARIVRITCWGYRGSYWAMRFEILGCKQDDFVANVD